MIILYIGSGKGKTSACVGQAVRALGQGMRVGFFQYMKREGAAGEQTVLRRLFGENFMAGGRGFLRDPETFPHHREAALHLTEFVRARIPDLDMVVLDEAVYALSAALITRDELCGIIALCGENGAHCVLSGRSAPGWLIEAADLVTDMTEMKHPYTRGIPAERGIEF